MSQIQVKCSLVLTFIFGFSILLLAENVFALPAYERLYRKKYGYKVSCYVCHSQGGGSALGGYGKDFKRNGLRSSTFGKIENKDSDRDGFKNSAEILAKSNPGDRRSTPDNPGDWMERMEEEFIPREQLVMLYPQATKFSIIEGTLNAKQIKFIESSLSRKLAEMETVPTLYFAFTGKGREAKRIGLAMFGSPPGKNGRMSIGIGIALNGKINKLVVYKSKEDKKVFQGEFLSQFEGKDLKSSFKLEQGVVPVEGEEKISAGFSDRIKLALLTMYQVFARR